MAARLGQVLPPVGGGWVPPLPPRELPPRELSPRELPPRALPRQELPDQALRDPELSVEEAAPVAGRHAATASPASVLDTWRAGRVSPGLRGALALGLVALLAVVLTVAVVVRGAPEEVAPPPVVATGLPVPGTSAEQPAGGPEVVVAVGGRVRRPGLVQLPAGSRVDDAVEAAGGATRPRDLALVNLARRLVDGEQVLVGVAPPDAPAGPAGGAAGAAGAAAGPLDLNTATLAQLDALPGIGPVLAQRVLDWRTEHGRFASVDQLREVSGIGEATYAKLEAQVRV